jgi:hypothetical protein
VNDEKKKMAILAGLAIGVVTIGATQFMGHRRPPPVADPIKHAVADNDQPSASATTGLKNPQVADGLPERDPFQAPADTLPKDVPAPGSKPSEGPKPFPHHGRAGGPKPFDPLPLPGSLPSSKGPGAPGTSLVPTPNYRCVAVIQGTKPIAVFEDVTGNQKMVRLGGSLDGETKLAEVHGTSVSIEVRGQRRRLSIGGNPVGK